MSSKLTTDQDVNSLNDDARRLLKESRDIAGITAEYIRTFLERFDDDKEQLLIYALSCNFQKIQETIESKLTQSGDDVSGQVMNPATLKEINILDNDFLEAISTYLLERDVDAKDKVSIQ